MTYLLVTLTAAILGIIIGSMAQKEQDKVDIQTAQLKEQQANHQTGKLSRKIHKQRLVIRSMKEKLPMPVRMVGSRPNLPQ